MRESDVRTPMPLVQADLLMGVDFQPAVTVRGVKSRSAESPTIETHPEARFAVALPTANRRSPALAEAPSPSLLPSMPEIAPNDRSGALEQLKARHDKECPLCSGPGPWTQTVFGEGSPIARLMFVGEAPGEEEDRTGRPFVGRAGQKLDEIIKAMNLSREQVYIANILKTRPPNNRTPLDHEVEACAPYLRDQIQIIRPSVMVALGGPAAKFLLSTTTGITQLRGRWAQYNDDDAGIRIPLMPTFHPAYLLRNYTRETRERVWSDMQAVLKALV